MGSNAKRFACNGLKLSRACSKQIVKCGWPVHIKIIELQTNEIEQLREELCQLKVDKATLTERVQELTKEPSAVKMEMVVSSLSD